MNLTWSTTGVTRRWIFGERYFCLFPSFKGSGRLMTYCLTSSSLAKLKSLRILVARFGPRRLGTVTSVRPGMSCKTKNNATQISHDLLHNKSDNLQAMPKTSQNISTVEKSHNTNNELPVHPS